MDIKMVVKRDDEYLTTNLEWSLDRSSAMTYVSWVAFNDANKYGGIVFLLFANKQEMEVSFRQMFDYANEDTIQ